MAKYQWLRLLIGMMSKSVCLKFFFFKNLCIWDQFLGSTFVAKQELSSLKPASSLTANLFSNISRQMFMISSFNHYLQSNPPRALQVNFWTHSKLVVLISMLVLPLVFQQFFISLKDQNVISGYQDFYFEYLRPMKVWITSLYSRFKSYIHFLLISVLTQLYDYFLCNSTMLPSASFIFASETQSFSTFNVNYLTQSIRFAYYYSCYYFTPSSSGNFTLYFITNVNWGFQLLCSALNQACLRPKIVRGSACALSCDCLLPTAKGTALILRYSWFFENLLLMQFQALSSMLYVLRQLKYMKFNIKEVKTVQIYKIGFIAPPQQNQLHLYILSKGSNIKNQCLRRVCRERLGFVGRRRSTRKFYRRWPSS